MMSVFFMFHYDLRSRICSTTAASRSHSEPPIAFRSAVAVLYVARKAQKPLRPLVRIEEAYEKEHMGDMLHWQGTIAHGEYQADGQRVIRHHSASRQSGQRQGRNRREVPQWDLSFLLSLALGDNSPPHSPSLGKGGGRGESSNFKKQSGHLR
jgi:hypothetical protein